MSERPTIGGLAQELLDEWRNEGEGDPSLFIDQRVADTVSPMTTVLFQMVVDDNSLAFLDAPIESSEPFAVLSSAIRDEVARQAVALIEAEIDNDDE